MKISDIAKKLDIPIKELRQYAKELGFNIAQKSKTISDKRAKEFIELVKKEKLAKGKEEIIEEKITPIPVKTAEVKEVAIPSFITVKEFSEKLELPVTRVITELMKNGVMASINENIDFQTAEIIGEMLGFKIKKESLDFTRDREKEKIVGTKAIRPPVVTIIGHVDHGKTTLLDQIRKTNVVAGESGGITQHIGAYQIEKKGHKITFLDTPGHEAFSAMREHGVRITDIAVLVVAADEGVKPQTRESINFAREAGVPIMVAINKIDKKEANIEKTKRELSDVGLIPEEWGGDTIIGNLSAKTGQGVDEFLDLILLLADLRKIESYIDIPANGFVIESHMSSTKGPMATILIRDGTLRVGNSFTIGKGVFGKIRAMTDWRRKRVKEARPSDAVRISGLSTLPNFGEVLEVEESSQKAKEKIMQFKKEYSAKGIIKPILGLQSVAQAIKRGELKELCLILKADVTGSLRAIKDTLENMRFEEVGVRVINEGIGEITESDVKLASAAKALIIGFKVETPTAVKKSAEKEGVDIEIFSVIYELIDKITLALSGLLEPECKEIEIGKGRVLKIFMDKKLNKILGIRVGDGEFRRDKGVKIFRGDILIAEGKITSLKKADEDTPKVGKGNECGVGVALKDRGEGKIKIEEGDEVMVYEKEIKEKELKKIIKDT